MNDNTTAKNETLNLSKEKPIIIAEKNHREISQNSKNLALIAWLGAIFFGFIPPLVVMLTQTDDTFIQHHAKESLNLAITTLIIYFVCGVTSFLILPIFLIFVVGIANLVLCIIAAVKASKGEEYRIPFPILRFIK